MTPVQQERKTLFRKAAERASLAPSIHNTQPWRFLIRSNALELWADNDRQLRALDPTGRQLVVSCGCALFNARVALAADGVVQVNRLPDASTPDLLARITLLNEAAPSTLLGRLDPMIDRRHTNRRDFLDQNVPPEVVHELITAAEQEEAHLVQIVEPERKMIAAQLSREAEAMQNADARYRAELRAWTATEIQRLDGVPVYAMPDTGPESKLEPLARTSDVAGRGWLPQPAAIEPQPLPDGPRHSRIQPPGMATCRRGAGAHSVGSHSARFCGEPRQPGGRGSVHTRAP